MEIISFVKELHRIELGSIHFFWFIYLSHLRGLRLIVGVLASDVVDVIYNLGLRAFVLFVNAFVQRFPRLIVFLHLVYKFISLDTIQHSCRRSTPDCESVGPVQDNVIVAKTLSLP